jgi:hypothetical protein
MYRATAALYLRLMGLVYAIAFASLYAQLPGACCPSAASWHADSAGPPCVPGGPSPYGMVHTCAY